MARKSRATIWLSAVSVSTIPAANAAATRITDRSNNVFAGRIAPATLGIETAPETENRLKDADLKVTPNSLRTLPVEAPRP